MKEKIFSITLSTQSKNLVFDDFVALKSDDFLKTTCKMHGVGLFLSRIADAIRFDIENVLSLEGNGDFVLTASENVLFFKLTRNTLIFYKYAGKTVMRNDRRLLSLTSGQFSFVIKRMNTTAPEIKRAYSVFGEGKISFPRLDDKQLEISANEQGNVLVKGVAGSGKTNLCIDRIIHSAVRSYSGKTLYSTYSRGLLIDTREKVNAFSQLLKDFVSDIDNGNVEFFGDKAKGASLKLNVTLNSSDKLASEIKGIINYLDNKVDYFLIPDLYRNLTGEKCNIADESTFVSFAKNLKNYRIGSSLEKLKNLEYEIIYKEIYGMIEGADEKPTMDEYVSKRASSFSRIECETIYALAEEYSKFLEKENLVDNNTLSRKICALNCQYSIAVLDEVQDFTECNLSAYKHVAVKLFCVGDALQMVNPSYFSFASLKRKLFEKDVTTVTELTFNYRNTARLNQIIDALNELNVSAFGTHSFVLSGESIDDADTLAIFSDGNTLKFLENKDLSALTIVVGGTKKKEELASRFPRAEILTVSDIKGLERETILLVDLLSDNADRFEKLERDKISHKTADENSVYRYWYNLFYVGVSRARRNLFVCERKTVTQFEKFFKENFDFSASKQTAELIVDTIGTAGLDELEICARIDEFISLQQFDNAQRATENLSSDKDIQLQSKRIEIYRTLIKNAEYEKAGIALWEIGLYDEAKKQFNLAGNSTLASLVDAYSGNGENKLDADIALYYPELSENEIARRLIIDTVNKDLSALKKKQAELSRKTKILAKASDRR